MSFKDWFEGHFGVTLPNFLYFEETDKKVFVKTFEGKEEKAEKEGLVAAKVNNGIYKPTTNFLQIYGCFAIRNVLLVSKEDAVRYAKGENIRTSLDGRGYVAVCYKNSCLGCGFLAEGVVVNQIPKARKIRA